MSPSEMTIEEIRERVVDHTRQLRLPGIKKEFESLAMTARMEKLSHEHYLSNLLRHEVDVRKRNRKKALVRLADFPYRRYLEDWNDQAMPQLNEPLSMLETLRFIEQGQNVIFSGNPGTGKTHLAIALGIKACMNNYRVLFTSTARLIAQIRESRSQSGLRALESKFENYDLVICDEFGYVSFDKEAAELLFTHLSLRCGRKSLIITTNLSFDRWHEIFRDPVLTAAMVDRLTHKAHMVQMNGPSYRLKETKEMCNLQT
jgi:DNA replication protein DnaC